MNHFRRVDDRYAGDGDILWRMHSTQKLLQDLVSIPAPPGQEGELARYLSIKLDDLGLKSRVDSKGNVFVQIGDSGSKTDVVVTAHMDEVALMVTSIQSDGKLGVTNLGGVYPWKWGEGPVEIMADKPLPGVLSFGSVHTESPASPIVQGRVRPIDWTQAAVFTGRSPKSLNSAGVRPGTRIVISRERRALTSVGSYWGGYFLDDRADLAAWLLIIQNLAKQKLKKSILFAATASEEVGGEGALFLLHETRPAICVALELGPIVPDSAVELSATPTCWVKDSFAAASPVDLELVATLGLPIQFQFLSSGGSDASCAALHGLCARPVTFGIPMENTHGYEIIHQDGVERLTELVLAYLSAI